MRISQSAVIFFAIILITGGLTMFTDLKIKKIYNIHLFIGASLGLAAIIYTGVWAHENVLFHIINGLIALVIGYCFHRVNLWKGGDAKLFMLYAFLMPALERDHILLCSAINLFACSFLAGMTILIPFFIKDIASNYNTVINKLLSPEKREDLFEGIIATTFYSWVLFPVYYTAGFLRIPGSSVMITYIIFYVARRFIPNPEGKMKYVVLVSGLTFGLLMHLWLSPHSLSWPVLPYSILKIGLFTAISACIYITLDLLKEYHDRVSFAPLLFIGCVLSYTPFLTWIMYLTRR